MRYLMRMSYLMRMLESSGLASMLLKKYGQFTSRLLSCAGQQSRRREDI
jgi:hypothetical protein